MANLSIFRNVKSDLSVFYELRCLFKNTNPMSLGELFRCLWYLRSKTILILDYPLWMTLMIQSRNIQSLKKSFYVSWLSLVNLHLWHLKVILLTPRCIIWYKLILLEYFVIWLFYFPLEKLHVIQSQNRTDNLKQIMQSDKFIELPSEHRPNLI
jgi:hypothetical protein